MLSKKIQAPPPFSRSRSATAFINRVCVFVWLWTEFRLNHLKGTDSQNESKTRQSITHDTTHNVYYKEVGNLTHNGCLVYGKNRISYFTGKLLWLRAHDSEIDSEVSPWLLLHAFVNTTARDLEDWLGLQWPTRWKRKYFPPSPL